MANHCSSGTSSGSGSGSGSSSAISINILEKLIISSRSNYKKHDVDNDIIIIEQRKRKRMVSNRDSARRSRLRKQKHEDDLTSEVCQLNKEKNVLIAEINRTTQKYSVFEAENWVLRAQVTELSHRLDSLCEIISFLNLSNSNNNGMINYYSVGYNNNMQMQMQPPPPADQFFTENNNIHAKATTHHVDMLYY